MTRLPPVLLLLAACAPDPLPTDAAGGAYVRGRFANLLGTGLSGARVCVRDACATTDGQGRFLLEGLPDEADVTVRVDAEGTFPVDLPHFTADSEPPWDKRLLGTGLMEDQARRAGGALDPDRGHLSFMVHQAHFREGDVDQTEGVGFILEPAPAGASTYFLSGPLQTADPDLQATTSLGAGGAFNLPPGRYDLSFTGTGGPCSRILSWDFEPGEPVPVEIVAGRGTYVDVLCPPAAR